MTHNRTWSWWRCLQSRLHPLPAPHQWLSTRRTSDAPVVAPAQRRCTPPCAAGKGAAERWSRQAAVAAAVPVGGQQQGRRCQPKLALPAADRHQQRQRCCSAKAARTSPCATAYWRLGCGWGCWWADSDWMAGWCTKEPLETRMQARPLGTRHPNCAAGAGQAHAEAIRPARPRDRQIAFRTLVKASRAALRSLPEQ